MVCSGIGDLIGSTGGGIGEAVEFGMDPMNGIAGGVNGPGGVNAPVGEATIGFVRDIPGGVGDLIGTSGGRVEDLMLRAVDPMGGVAGGFPLR